MYLPPLPHETTDRVLASPVAGFPVASQELIVDRNLLKRTDTKFVFRVEQFYDLLTKLHGDYAIVRAGSRPVATYKTLYFDTAELQCFHAHRKGRRPRHKVRVRHYPDRRISYFEIKTRKTENFTQKLRIAVPQDTVTLTDSAHALIAAHGAVYRGPLEPQVWTDFHRLTLLGLRTEERVTIDLDLHMGQPGALIALEGIAIAEVKQAAFSAQTPIMRALRDFGLRPTPASKYCTAIALTREGVRFNRLKPALRAI